MNGLPYYKRYPRDFIEGTIGMPLELKGAYSVLLDLIYLQGGRLPDDPRYIAGLLGCSVRAWNRYRQTLLDMGKIESEHGFISNFRADNELESLGSFSEQQSKKRIGKRKVKDLPTTMVNPRIDHTDTDTDKRATLSNKARGEDVVMVFAGIASEAVAKDFIAHRAGLKAKLTVKAAELIARKLAPLGIAAADAALLRSIESGWRGVFPEQPRNGGSTNGQRASNLAEGARRYLEWSAKNDQSLDGEPGDDHAVALLPARH